MTYLVVIAWFYVALMMSLAEAFSTQGSILGAIVTLFLYGIGPIALVVYLMGTPARRKARQAQEQREASSSFVQPDAGRHATGTSEQAGTPSVGEENR
jgi:Kef-type K+ transport system membrane component KefB